MPAAFRQRHYGRTLSVAVRKASGKGSLVLDRERSMGLRDFVFAYLLLLRVGNFDPRCIACIAPLAAGHFLSALFGTAFW